MNILLVAPWRLDAMGGVSVAVGMLYRELEGAGHRVLALIGDESSVPKRIPHRSGYDVFGMYCRSPYIRGAPLRALFVFLLCLPLTLIRLRSFLAENRIEAVHLHYPLPSTVYFGLLRRLSGWRLVVTYQGSDAHDLPSWSLRERMAVRLLLTAADHVTGVSSSLLAKVADALPGAEFRGAVVPNGAPIEEIQQSELPLATVVPERYIVTVGLLIKRKGVDLIIDALAMLARQGERVTVVVVGDGDERAALERHAAEKGIASSVIFVGRQSHEQTVAIMKHSTLFVLASRAEGLPLVIAEAMACGKAVIATVVDGVPEIVTHEQNGLLVPSDDVLALAATIQRLWRDGPARERLEQGAKETVASFSWCSIAGRYAALYASGPLRPPSDRF